MTSSLEPTSSPAPAAASRVAVLGLGAMGLPMACHLACAEGAEVRGFDPVAQRRDLAAESGVAPFDSAAAAVEGAGVAVIAVRSADQLEAVLFGEGGAAESLAPGSVVIVTSTVGSACVLQVEARLAERDVLLVDAPVSGGAVRAADGDLLIMIGGSPAALEAGRAVLGRLGSALVEMGPAGAGQNMKTVNQLLCGIHTAAAAEALAMADSLGLDPARCVEVFMQGAAASFMLGDRGPRMAQQLKGERPPLRSRLDIIDKDMGIVGDLNRVGHLPTPVAGAAENLYRTAMRAGLAAEDDSALAAYLAGRPIPGLEE